MLSDDSDLRGPAMHSRLWRPPQGKPGLPSVERLIGGISSMTVSLDRVSSNVAARGSTDGLSQVCWFSLMRTVVHQHTTAGKWRGFTGKDWEFSKREQARRSRDGSSQWDPGAKPQLGIWG